MVLCTSAVEGKDEQMSEVLLARVTAAWDTLSQHYHWQLPVQRDVIVQEAVVRLDHLPQANDRTITAVIVAVYGQHLHAAFVSGNNAAAEDLFHACFRSALRQGLTSEDAEETAQETVTRMVYYAPRLRSSETIISYAFDVLRTVLRERRSEPFEAPLDNREQQEQPIIGQPDGQATITAVERRVFNDTLLVLLRQKLPSPLERTMLIRTVLLDDKPRDVAHDLNIPGYQARTARHRALNRLREDAEFMLFCSSLLPDTASG